MMTPPAPEPDYEKLAIASTLSEIMQAWIATQVQARTLKAQVDDLTAKLQAALAMKPSDANAADGGIDKDRTPT